jgi:hypothetical protein
MSDKIWKRVTKGENPLCKVYVRNVDGGINDIKVVYPKAPKWAQKIAMQIYEDGKRGFPNEKGVNEIVRGLWAAMIAEAVKKEKENG